MKFAFLCDRPFQIFNCINFVYHNVEGSAQNSDLYIWKNFNNSEVLIQKVRESGIFSHVYAVEFYMSPRHHKFNMLKMMLFPAHALGKGGRISVKNIRNQKYEVVMASCPNPFLIHFISFCKNSIVCFFDDGTGSYVGDLMSRFTSKTYHLFGIIFKRGPEYIHVDKLYVNNICMCHSPVSRHILSLPTFNTNDEKYRNLLFRVFSHQKSDLYLKLKMVYLNQPLNDYDVSEENGAAFDGYQKEILKHIRNKHSCGTAAVMRLHPSENNVELPQGFKMDLTNNLWELICADQITDQHVLISFCSTAQMTPKMIFNKEPYLIFTCNIVARLLSKELVDGWKQLIHFLKNNYSHPEKIFMPETMEQFDEILENLKDSEK